MKKFLLYILMFAPMFETFAQKSKDLFKVSFTENTSEFLKGVSSATGRPMYALTNMLSYSIDNTGKLVYASYVPYHIELLSFNNNVAGYNFKIEDFKSQKRLLSRLKARYPKLALVDSSRWGKIYSYYDSKITIELHTIDATEFKEQRTGHFSVKTIALLKAIGEQEKKYRRDKN